MLGCKNLPTLSAINRFSQILIQNKLVKGKVLLLTTNKNIIPQYEVHEETLQVLKHYPYQQVVHQRDEPEAISVLVVV